MLNKLKKFMVIAAAAVMLSVGFATIAPKEASAHWADTQMDWAMRHHIVTADLRDSLATRQDAWLMLARYFGGPNKFSSYAQARSYLMSTGNSRITDGTRGTNWITRNEMVAMLYNHGNHGGAWDPEIGFERSRSWGVRYSIFDGKREDDFATRAEVIGMIYNGWKTGNASTWINFR